MFGNVIITLALVVSVFSGIMYYLTIKGYDNTIKLARIGYHLTSLLVVAASILLLYAIVNHQYQYAYVYNYSGSGLSFGLLLSTFYAGQQGSFMLWLFFTAIVGVFLMEYTSKRDDLEPRVMAIYSLIVTFLLIMVNPLLKSPFNLIWADPSFIDVKNFNQTYLSMPFLQSFFFSDPNSSTSFIKVNKELISQLSAQGIAFNDFLIEGKGLNPLLQNFWMQIHPPFLFLGFALSGVPFTFAFAALVKNEYKDWISQSLPWVLSSMMVLGLAIMLGGYWAYGVLGWGGYWGWDPVENSSFVPWLIGVAAVHTMLVQKKSQSNNKPPRFVKTNLLLAILTFVAILYSTFLTRSGILGDASVHSFVDPGMTVYLFLIVLVGVFTILGIGGIIYRWKYLSENFTYEENVFSRELALFTGSITLIASAIIVTVGTSAPIFGTSVETRFYNELTLPLAIIIGIVNGLSLYFKWKQTKGKDVLKSLQLPAILSIVFTAIITFFTGFDQIMLTIFTATTLFSLIINIQIASKIIKGKLSFLGAYITHTGLAFFFLGVIATGGFSQHKQVALERNVPQKVMGYDLTFKGWTPFANGKKYHFNIEVAKNEVLGTAAPIMYVAEFNNSLMREPDILNFITEDIYIAPVSYEQAEDNSGKKGKEVSLNKGESINFGGTDIKFTSFDFPKDAMNSMMGGGKFQIGVNLEATTNGKTVPIKPILKFEGKEKNSVPAEIPNTSILVAVNNLQAAGQVNLSLFNKDDQSQSTEKGKEILSVEASIKPFINLVWLGVLVMVAGFLVSIFRRTEEAKA